MQIRKLLLLFIDGIDEMYHVIQNVYAVKPHNHTRNINVSLCYFNGETHRNSSIQFHFQMNKLHYMYMVRLDV